jgi:NADPH:quinone reductase-like Zn-dependent oxidoreductase
MSWQHVRISRFGGPEELAEESTISNPGPGEVRIKVLAAGTGFTDSFIRRGRYPDFKGGERDANGLCRIEEINIC